MKRYLIFRINFDTRATILNWTIEESWEPLTKQLHEEGRATIRQSLLDQYGTLHYEAKLKDFRDFGAIPFFIVDFHNRFFLQTRDSFVIGGYYPALTASCAFGERILNHLLLRLRNHYKNTPEYKDIHGKNSFDDWDVPIKTLKAWNVLQPDALEGFKKLKTIRNAAIHFRPETDHNDRALALSAIEQLRKIIEAQFGGAGMLPWFILDTPGASFLKQSYETDPFVRIVYIPNCALVGPYYRVEDRAGKWTVVDDYPYEQREISDEEFAALCKDRANHPKAT